MIFFWNWVFGVFYGCVLLADVAKKAGRMQSVWKKRHESNRNASKKIRNHVGNNKNNTPELWINNCKIGKKIRTPLKIDNNLIVK